MAKKVYNSDIFIFLPRHLRYAIIHFIVDIMIEIKRPFEKSV